MRALRALVLVWFFGTLPWAEAASIHVPLELRHFADPSRTLTIEQLLAQGDNGQWEAAPGPTPRYGFTHARHWFRFVVTETREIVGKPLILEMSNVYLKHLDIYSTLDGKVIRHYRGGLGVPLLDSEADLTLRTGRFTLRLPAPRNPQVVYFAAVETDFPLSFPTLMNLGRDFVNRQLVIQHLLGIFFGILFFACVFNVFLAVSLRSRLYTFYSLFVGSITMLYLVHEGVTVQYFWPQSPWLVLREPHIYEGLTLIFYATFVRELLRTRTFLPRLDRLLVGLVMISTLRSLWLMVQPNQIVALSGEVTVIATNFLIIVIALMCLRKRLPSARLFLFSSMIFNVGAILYLLQDTNIFCVAHWVNLAPSVGTGVEVELLSLALADRVRRTNFDLVRANEKLDLEIRERARAEKELALQRAAMIQADKMSALGRMAGEIAHEINNPLAIIHGNAVLLKKVAEEGGEVGRMADIIEQTSTRISKVVKAMRSVARDSKDDPITSCSLASILRDVLSICRERFREAGVELSVAVPDPDIEIFCRPTEVCQVLVNLLNNAYDAVEGKSGAWTRVDLEKRKDKAVISVTDSGPGVPLLIRSRILEPFFTTKEVGKGLGLGLSISKSLVSGHQGELWLDEASPNTRFAFTVPLAEENQA